MTIESLAVCLTTCERPDNTRRTLEAFAEYNDLDRFMLLHADDASTTDESVDLAAMHGFKTVARHEKRKGAQETRRSAAHAARDLGATHVLLLENDWVAVKPFPWELADYVMSCPEIYTFRLFGLYRVDGNRKDPSSCRPCLNRHAGRDNVKAEWTELDGAPGVEVASIHMGTAPCVTGIDDLCWLLASADSASAMMVTSGQIDRLTARPKNSDNWFWDIGWRPGQKGHDTPGFVA